MGIRGKKDNKENKKPEKGKKGGNKKSKLPPYFGSKLVEIAEYSEMLVDGIPKPIVETVAVLRKSGLDVEGLFRVPGSAKQIGIMKELYNQGKPVELPADMHTVGGLLKAYLRAMPEPLLTYERYGVFMTAQKIEDPLERCTTLRDELGRLPQINYNVLCYLMSLMHDISKLSEVNKMSNANLALVFGPVLLGPEDDATGYKAMEDAIYINGLVRLILDEFDFFIQGARYPSFVAAPKVTAPSPSLLIAAPPESDSSEEAPAPLQDTGSAPTSARKVGFAAAENKSAVERPPNPTVTTKPTAETLDDDEEEILLEDEEEAEVVDEVDDEDDDEDDEDDEDDDEEELIEVDDEEEDDNEEEEEEEEEETTTVDGSSQEDTSVGNKELSSADGKKGAAGGLMGSPRYGGEASGSAGPNSARLRIADLGRNEREERVLQAIAKRPRVDAADFDSIQSKTWSAYSQKHCGYLLREAADPAHELVQQLSQLRAAARRPEEYEQMELEHLRAEQADVARLLKQYVVAFEKAYGRTLTPMEDELLRPLYYRQRQLQEMLELRRLPVYLRARAGIMESEYSILSTQPFREPRPHSKVGAASAPVRVSHSSARVRAADGNLHRPGARGPASASSTNAKGAASAASSSRLSPAEDEERKRLKRELNTFRTQFLKENGRPPKGADWNPVKKSFLRYSELKKRIA